MMNNLYHTYVPPQASCAPRYYMLGYDLKCHAWCPELGRVVTASEIWNMMFGDETTMPMLTFQCVDEVCRTHLILRNCYAHMSDIEAQFRLYPRARHHHQCAYIVEQQQKKNKIKSHRRLEAMQAGPRLRGWYA